MRLLKTLAPVAAAASLFAAPMAAQAALVIMITDGVNSVSVADNSGADWAPDLGSVSYFATNLFGKWELTFASGTSDSDPLQMHLTSMVTGTSGDGTLTIKLTQTDLTAASPIVRLTAGGGGFGVGSASWASYVDDSNALFGTATQVASSAGYDTTAGGADVALSGLYSATLVTTFTYGSLSAGRKQSSLDVGMNVPEPASLALVGLGLLGLGAARRRKG